MGAWGPGLFSDDLAMDVRSEFRELVEDGVDDADATRRVTEAHAESITDPDEGPTFWLALAFTQSKLGRLDPMVRDRALVIIERGEGLHLWEDDPKLLAKRKETLEKVKAQLTGPQPARRRLRPPTRHVTDLVSGDLLLFRAGTRCTLMRVARLTDDRYGVRPVLVVLDFEGPEPPAAELVAAVPDRRELKLPVFTNPLPPWWFTSFQPMVHKRVDYRQAGFVSHGRIVTRPGDEACKPQSYGTWDALAKSLARWLNLGSVQTSHQ
jgi:hypothetical protein